MRLEKLRDYLEVNGRKLYIVEIGAGCPVAQGLYECPGASKVVYHSESPYGSAKHLYGERIGSNRMVSREAVSAIIEEVKTKKTDTNFNMIIVTSFQVRSADDDKLIPHGCVGISTFTEGQWIDHYAHMTLSNPWMGFFDSRESSILNIAWDIERLITGHVSPLHVDISDGPTVLFSECPVFFRNHKAIRLEDVSRNYKRIVLYKGSFNPIHKGHLEIANRVIDEETLVIFAISKNTYEKGEVDISSLIRRVTAINNAGFLVALFKVGYFFDNVQYLKNRTGLDIELAMGVDTFNRLINCYNTCDFSSNEEAKIIDHLYTHELVAIGDSVADAITKHKNLLFNLNFYNVVFHVFGRRAEINTDGIDLRLNFHKDFDIPISSSEIRNQMKPE